MLVAPQTLYACEYNQEVQWKWGPRRNSANSYLVQKFVKQEREQCKMAKQTVGLNKRKKLEIDLINIPKYCVTSLHMLFNLHAWRTYTADADAAAV